MISLYIDILANNLPIRICLALFFNIHLVDNTQNPTQVRRYRVFRGGQDPQKCRKLWKSPKRSNYKTQDKQAPELCTPIYRKHFNTRFLLVHHLGYELKSRLKSQVFRRLIFRSLPENWIKESGILFRCHSKTALLIDWTFSTIHVRVGWWNGTTSVPKSVRH